MNKVQVSLDEDGRIHLSRAGYGDGIYTLETTEALRAFFQAERDETLGRWRDPENPGIVCYPVAGDLDAVWVMREGDGSRYHATRTRWEHLVPHYVAEAARRYFQAHFEPKPWEKARPGEVWVLTIEGGVEAWRLNEYGKWTNISATVLLANPPITAGRRIWPEENK